MSTNLNTYFKNELLSLSNETKRKYPKIKEVSIFVLFTYIILNLLIFKKKIIKS